MGGKSSKGKASAADEQLLTELRRALAKPGPTEHALVLDNRNITSELLARLSALTPPPQKDITTLCTFTAAPAPHRAATTLAAAAAQNSCL